MTKRKLSRQLHRLVRERARFCCEYCISQEAYSPDPFSTEHIFPEVLGGGNTEDNLALACQGCNNLKYIKTTAIDPITSQEAPLFHPRKDVWNEHFTWSEFDRIDWIDANGPRIHCGVAIESRERR